MGSGEVFWDEPICHRRQYLLKTLLSAPGSVFMVAQLSTGSVKQLYYGNCLAQGSESPAQMTLQPLWERD